MTLANQHGAFVEKGARLEYVPAPDTSAFHMTMMSRKGLLPEADFFNPVPYEPLAHCTAERSLATLTPETFAESYFDRRRDVDPFDWAETNLREAEQNYAREHTIAWRYAILRMHEVVALVVPYLDDDDFERFMTHLKPVFVDDYATVPHESIKRLLALHGSGKLDLMALGERYRIDTHCDEGGAVVQVDGKRLHFPVFIEATGQRSSRATQFPFPSLVEQGIIRDEPCTKEETPARGIVVDDSFHPLVEGEAVDELFCLSLPFLLGRHPFIQGITSSQEMGSAVADVACEQRLYIHLRPSAPARAPTFTCKYTKLKAIRRV